MADKDLDRIKRIADTLPDLDRAFLNRVAATLVDQEKAIQLHEATHELNFSTLEQITARIRQTLKSMTQVLKWYECWWLRIMT
jgi:hypothetical protein